MISPQQPDTGPLGGYNHARQHLGNGHPGVAAFAPPHQPHQDGSAIMPPPGYAGLRDGAFPHNQIPHHGHPPGPPQPNQLGHPHHLGQLTPEHLAGMYGVPIPMAPFRPVYMAPVPMEQMHAAVIGAPPPPPHKVSAMGETQLVSKRTKVSRACDECRRKKTRCDIDSEKDTCSPCRRAKVQCTFARAQLKRGPTKKRDSQSSGTSGGRINGVGSAVSPKARARPRSASDSTQASEVLPPIEALLGFSRGSPNVNGMAFPPRSPSGSPPTNAKQAGSLPSNGGFPMLVEVACTQSDSPPLYSSSVPKQVGLAATGAGGAGIAATDDAAAAAANANAVSANGPMNAKPATPPVYYDNGLQGVSHRALMEYYTFMHPIFPVLPDTVEEFDSVFRAAGPAKEYLVEAINGTEVTVPLGAARHGGGVDLEAHLVAMMFAYLRTLDFAWLGASVAACVLLAGESPQRPCIPRLAALVVAFDLIHEAVFRTQRLAPEHLLVLASQHAPLAATIDAVRNGRSSDHGNDHFFRSAPQITLQIFGQIAHASSPKAEHIATLESLLPQLARTPLEGFVRQVLARHSSASPTAEASSAAAQDSAVKERAWTAIKIE